MARIQVSDLGMYSFNARVIELQSQSSRNRKVSWYLNTSYIGANTIGTGTTVSPIRTFSNLNAGTSYTLRAELYWSDTGAYITSLSTTITTNKPPDSVRPTIDTLITNIPPSGFTSQSTFNISTYARDNYGGVGLSNAELYINNVYKANKTLSSTSNTEVLISFTNISIPTSPSEYKITIIVYDKNGNSNSSSISQPIYYDNTSPILGNVSMSQEASGIKVSALATDNLGIDCIVCQISKPNERTFVSTSLARVEIKSGNSHIFTKDANGNNFVSGNIYYVKFTAKDKANNYSSAKESFLTFSNQRPSDFNWTQSERDAFTGKGSIKTLTYIRWNKFVEHIKEMASWKHNTTEDIYGVLDAKMSNTVEGRTLTAVKFNKVKNSIGSMNATGISDVKKGDVVKGEYFITLSSKLGGVTKSTGLGTLNQIHNLDLLYCIGRLEDGIRCK